MVLRSRQGGFQLPVHKAITRIREALGWSKTRLAVELGMRPQEWYRYETGSRATPLVMIERIRELTGIDPYVLAYSLYYDSGKLPGPVQEKIAALRDEWDNQINLMSRNRMLLPLKRW